MGLTKTIAISSAGLGRADQVLDEGMTMSIKNGEHAWQCLSAGSSRPVQQVTPGTLRAQG